MAHPVRLETDCVHLNSRSALDIILVNIWDRLSLAAGLLSDYHLHGTVEEQGMPTEVVALCLIAWMSVNKHDIPGFEEHAKMLREQMMLFLPWGQYYPVASVMMLRGPAAQAEGMNSLPPIPALQPSVPSAQETEQDLHFLPLPYYQMQKAKSQAMPAAVEKQKR